MNLSSAILHTVPEELSSGHELEEVRNPDGRLVCKYDPITEAVERKEKGWITRIIPVPNDIPRIIHIKA